LARALWAYRFRVSFVRSFAQLFDPMALKLLLASALLAGASATELTEATWDEKTAGKSVFVKFQAPW